MTKSILRRFVLNWRMYRATYHLSRFVHHMDRAEERGLMVPPVFQQAIIVLAGYLAQETLPLSPWAE